MTDLSLPSELARAEIAGLLPVRDQLSRREGVLRSLLADAHGVRRDSLFDKALRCERVMRLLDARIRLAAEVIANGGVASLSE